MKEAAMAQRTKIEWTLGGMTWNPIRGCSKVSPGCEFCYAAEIAARFSGTGLPYAGLAKRDPVNWTGRMKVVEDAMTQPFKWKSSRLVFVNSMSDMFHENLTDETITRILAVTAACPQHTFQILTKRAERMRNYFRDPRRLAEIEAGGWKLRENDHYHGGQIVASGLRNVWLGVSAENQECWDERSEFLADVHVSAVRFVSAEPLLGPIAFDFEGVDSFLDWVIVGGESGRGARPCYLQWIRLIVNECNKFQRPCFVKQLGSHVMRVPGERIYQKDKKGGDPSEWPEYFHVRQMPEPAKVA
jgi:protein gp37